MTTVHSDEGFTVEASGAVIRGTRRGAGEPFVLLHGGPGCYDYFAGSALVDWLAPAYAVYSYDQRGCRNSPSGGPYTIAANVADLEAVRHWIGADQLNVLGHSAGAVLALHYAAAHPARVDRLILLSPAGVRRGWQAAFDATIRERLTAEQRRRLAEIDHKIMRTPDQAERTRLYQERFNLVLPCYVEPRHRDVAPTMDYYNREVNVRTSASIQQSYRDALWQGRMRRFHGPACIIHGRSDPIPWTVVDELVGILPRAEVKALERCGHFPWLEEPAACRAALLAFLHPRG